MQLTDKDFGCGLSYKRSITPSRGLMYTSTGHGQALRPLIVNSIQIMGKKSFDVRRLAEKLKQKNGAFQDDILDQIVSPNPQRIDTAVLPEDSPWLVVEFDLKYLCMSRTPNSSGNSLVRKALVRLASLYASSGGYKVLANKLVVPLVLGRWMWRNNDEAVKRFIDIEQMYVENPRKWSFEVPYGASTIEDLEGENAASQVEELAKLIELSLSGSGPLVPLRVRATYLIGGGMQAYPSEIIDLDSSSRGSASKSLVKVISGGAEDQAAITDRKIGNGLRTIDEWHGDSEYGPIPVEAYGVVMSDRVALRASGTNDFYTLIRQCLQSWTDSLDQGGLDCVENVSDLHFFMAMLVRGGVFL